MTRFRTNKEYPHGYLPDYERIAAELGPRATVCEIGVWHGESLEMWQELFPQGTVVGVDIDPGMTWPRGTGRVVMSQDDPALPQAVQLAVSGARGYDLADPCYLDLVVDDASHIGKATQATFWLLWPMVARGGYYVIEDWTTALDLGQWAPYMISAVREGAATVTYTSQGLIIVRRPS